MAHTPALPFGIGVELSYIPRADAVRHIPVQLQPRFGIVPNGVIPGIGPIANAFYNPLDYANLQPSTLLTPNMPQNMYLGFIPGISRAPQS